MRKAILTIGKTHSGKTTFAKRLEEMSEIVVVDQDNHAKILNEYYPLLVPKEGVNQIKYSFTDFIVEYIVKQTPFHLIMCNANLNHQSTERMIRHFKENGFQVITIYFNLPMEVLKKRIDIAGKDQTILRSRKSFEEVLINQEVNIAFDELAMDYHFDITDKETFERTLNSVKKLLNKE